MAIQEIVCSLFQLGTACYSMPMDVLLVEKLLVPSVVLIIAIYVITNMFLGNLNLKIKSLLAITFYIVCVYTGFYTVIASFSMPFLFLFFILGFGAFVITRFIPMHWIVKGGKMATKLGESRYDIRLMKDRLEVLKKEKKTLENKIDQEKAKGKDASESMINAYELLITQMDVEMDLLTKEIKRTKGIIPH